MINTKGSRFREPFKDINIKKKIKKFNNLKLNSYINIKISCIILKYLFLLN